MGMTLGTTSAMFSYFGGKIGHWKITNLDYRKVTTKQKATWFVDAPYQFRRSNYMATVIDFDELRDWVLAKRGQIIVCEKSSANWLPFTPLATQQGTSGKKPRGSCLLWLNENSAARSCRVWLRTSQGRRRRCSRRSCVGRESLRTRHISVECSAPRPSEVGEKRSGSKENTSARS